MAGPGLSPTTTSPGLAHRARAGELLSRGPYRPERVDAAYRALLARARTAVERGESVILDASWADTRWRQAAAETARITNSELVELRCEAPLELAGSEDRVPPRRANHSR